MPIKDKTAYPADWKAISLRIRERDQNKCVRCGVANGAWIVRWRDKDGEGYTVYSNAQLMEDGTWDAWQEDERGYICSETDTFDPKAGDGRPVKIVLTVAHLENPDPMDVRDENLAALCQQCHNRLDMPMRQQHAKVTRIQKKRAAFASAGQLEIEL